MCFAIPWPWIGPKRRVRMISRSSVPCNRPERGDLVGMVGNLPRLVDYLPIDGVRPVNGWPRAAVGIRTLPGGGIRETIWVKLRYVNGQIMDGLVGLCARVSGFMAALRQSV